MEVIINSLFPLLFTVVIFAIPIRKWMDSMVVAGGISLIYEPEHLTIFYSFSDTEPILVKLENRTKEKQKFDLQINFPDEVQWKNNNDIHKGTYEESVTVPSNEQRRFDFLVRYRGNDKQADQIAIKAIHDEFSTEEIISVIKDPS